VDDPRKIKTIPPSRRIPVPPPAPPPPAPPPRANPSDARNAIIGALGLTLVVGYLLWSRFKPVEVTDLEREAAWVETGKHAVREKLKDPESAQFKDASFHRGAEGVPLSCGMVNSKNGVGGYVGWTRYMSGGSSDTTFLESEVRGGFQESWSQFCTSAQNKLAR
jgi:hypothetical protein